MGRLKWRDFKGLYTNIDASDKGAEYFSKFKDIKVYPGYIESQGLNLTEQAYGLPLGHTFVREQYVFLDEDKYQNTVNGATTLPELEFVLNDGYRTDIHFRGTPTTTEAHSYKIRISGIVDPPNLLGKCFAFKWSKDGGEESEAIPANDGENNYTQEWFSLPDGLEIQFDEYMYDPIPADKVWLIRSDWTTPVITNEDPLELTNNYIQNIQKYLFQISYKDGNYHFFIDRQEIGNSPFADVANQYPKIINEKGILKVLMKKQALWIGKVNRSYWTKETGDIRVATIPSGFYAYPLVYPLENNLSRLFNISIIPENSLPEEKQVTAKIFSKEYDMEYQGINYEVAAIKFEDENGIVFYPDRGYLPLWKVRKKATNESFYAMWFGQAEYIKSFIAHIPPIRDLAGFELLLTNENYIDNPFGTEKFFIMDEALLLSNFDNKEVTLNMVAVGFGSDFGFSDGDNLEVVTTIMTSSGEFPISYEEIADTVGSFIIKIDWNSANIKNLYKDKLTANVYFRYNKDATADEAVGDYELCYTVPFVAGSDEASYAYINKLIPNGIFLTQTIGKFFDPDTYKIITAFDDYTDVAGIPYILKNSNVHFPAVGGGSILNNFYYENVVPGIEGERLIALTNLLGVFSGTKELMTLIDFSPVESSMIFYIKDTLQYKIRDEKDIAETSEGTFLHLKEGIYVTNGRERTLISEPINDLVRKYYKNASIFYNSYWKQLYYYTGASLYCFDFETQSWCEYSLPKDWDKNNLIDFIEDFEGRIFFIAKDKSYQLEFESKEGLLELSYLDLQEYSISKRINYLCADHIGELKAIDRHANGSNRAIRYIFNKLDNRKPIKDIAIEVKFNGTLYGIELDIETIRTDQL